MASSIALDEYETLWKSEPKRTITEIKRSLKKPPQTVELWGAYRYVEKDEQAKEAKKILEARSKWEKASLAEREKLPLPPKVKGGDFGEYVFTKDGQLGLPGGGTITQYPQTAASTEAIEAFYARRKTDMERLETNVTAARTALREFVMNEYVPKLRAGEVGDSTREMYLELNQQVEDAVRALEQRVTFPRNVDVIEEHLELRKLDIHDWYAVNTIPDPVFVNRSGRFPWKTMWAKGSAPPAPAVEAIPIAAAESLPPAAAAPAQAPALPAEATAAANKKRAFFAGLAKKKKAAGL